MTKWLKLGVIALSVLALAGTIISVNANEDYEARLVITQWTNVCTWHDYDFSGYNASTEAQPINAVVHPVTCDFLENEATTVSYQLMDLVNENSVTLEAINFNMTATASDGTQWGTLAGTFNALSDDTCGSGQLLYTKPVNQMWAILYSGDHSIEIDGTIPAWQPAGTYTGTLQLSW